MYKFEVSWILCLMWKINEDIAQGKKETEDIKNSVWSLGIP